MSVCGWWGGGVGWEGSGGGGYPYVVMCGLEGGEVRGREGLRNSSWIGLQ